MFKMWDVQEVRCSGFGMFLICNVCGVGCLQCVMFRMWDF